MKKLLLVTAILASVLLMAGCAVYPQNYGYRAYGAPYYAYTPPRPAYSGHRHYGNNRNYRDGGGYRGGYGYGGGHHEGRGGYGGGQGSYGGGRYGHR